MKLPKLFFNSKDQKTLAEILSTVRAVLGKVVTFMAQVDDLKNALDGISENLDNIVQDEAALAKQIADLQAIIQGGGVVTAEQMQALVDQAKALQDRTKGVADSIPDTPPTP